MKKRKSSCTFINYEHFSKTYILMAKMAILQKKDVLNLDKLSHDDIWRINESKLIMIPVIYCIRHSLELFLKSIDIGLSGEYFHTHDIEKLSEILKKGALEDCFDNLTPLIDKYVNYNFLERIISKPGIDAIDEKNEVFRFPDNDSSIKIESKNLKKLKNDDILNDIEELKKIYNIASTRWQLHKNHNPLT